jgi:hypothetical protein
MPESSSAHITTSVNRVIQMFTCGQGMRLAGGGLSLVRVTPKQSLTSGRKWPSAVSYAFILYGSFGHLAEIHEQRLIGIQEI